MYAGESRQGGQAVSHGVIIRSKEHKRVGKSVFLQWSIVVHNLDYGALVGKYLTGKN